MNSKVMARVAAVGATGLLAVGALATTANAQVEDLNALQQVEATATQTGNYTATVCIGDNTTAACTTLSQGQSFDRFPSYNGADPITVNVMPEGGRDVFETVRVSGTELNVVLSGSAQAPVVQVR
jgi:hypothetical protein